MRCEFCGKVLPLRFGLATIRECPKQTTGLAERIDRCPHRGEATGQFVTCGCASFPKQPVFVCAIKGLAVRHKPPRTKFDGAVCIACEIPRGD